MFYNTYTMKIGCDNMSENNTITNTNKEINLVKYSVEEIEDLIYTIRGKQVMLNRYYQNGKVKNINYR